MSSASGNFMPRPYRGFAPRTHWGTCSPRSPLLCSPRRSFNYTVKDCEHKFSRIILWLCSLDGTTGLTNCIKLLLLLSTLVFCCAAVFWHHSTVSVQSCALKVQLFEITSVSIIFIWLNNKNCFSVSEIPQWYNAVCVCVHFCFISTVAVFIMRH